MPYTINYTKPQKVDLSEMEEWAVNQDKTVKFSLKNGTSFKMNLLDRWGTYTEIQKSAFKFIIGDTMEHGEAEDGTVINSVGGDL